MSATGNTALTGQIGSLRSLSASRLFMRSLHLASAPGSGPDTDFDPYRPRSGALSMNAAQDSSQAARILRASVGGRQFGRVVPGVIVHHHATGIPANRA